MKKRLTGKKASIAVLSVLIIISFAEIVLRGVLLKEASLNITNTGEPIITALFSLMLVIFANKGKDRLFYICTGGFLAYFVLKQLFGLPEMIATLVSMAADPDAIVPAMISVALCTISMIGIIAIGVLLVEYMNDGTIYKRAFNILCIITVLINLVHAIMLIGSIITVGYLPLMLALLNNVYRSIMVFLFTFFAYDSAKEQLAKTKL